MFQRIIAATDSSEPVSPSIDRTSKRQNRETDVAKTIGFRSAQRVSVGLDGDRSFLGRRHPHLDGGCFAAGLFFLAFILICPSLPAAESPAELVEFLFEKYPYPALVLA